MGFKNSKTNVLTPKSGSAIVPKPQASVAQLDRASVFGTEPKSTQPTDFKELANFKKSDSPGNSLTRFELPVELQNIIVQWDNLPQHVKETIQ
ncbi:MAG: hypothetical protein ACYSOR_03900, partial [Planctomycetota bacterium]